MVLRVSESISSLIDVTVSPVLAEVKRIKPDIPALPFAGIGSQTH